MNTNYTSVIIFTKHTNLLPWFDGKYGTELGSGPAGQLLNQRRLHYSRDRDVQLILLVRYEFGNDNLNHIYCKIKCPINPLPIYGEFEVVSIAQITNFLQREGWTIKNKLPIPLLK